MSRDLFLSVDWGTTNFRLRLVEKSSARILKEITLPVGVQSLYNQWKENGGDREIIFLHFLKQHVEQIEGSLSSQTEMVISGMASSSIGIRELAYAPLPLHINGKELNVELIKHELFPGGFYLVSGVCSDSDIMRGEETQIIGLASNGEFAGTNIFILPGTHSKHVTCTDDKITGLCTFMTGELFQTICTHTILKGSVEKPGAVIKDMQAFDDGVMQARHGVSILNSLFGIRARHILNKNSAVGNFYFLSGLLIGEELATIKYDEADNVLLCAGNSLGALYSRAMALLPANKKTTILDEKLVDNAVVKGHVAILKQQAEMKYS